MLNYSTNFKRKKIKSILLKVSAPFHCSLMKPASENMKDKINTKFKTLLAIVNNVTSQPENDPDIIKNYLLTKFFLQLNGRKFGQY